MKRVDYSERAIAVRIERVSQLRQLCLSLAKAGQLKTETKVPDESKKDRD